jgi:Peptidase family M28
MAGSIYYVSHSVFPLGNHVAMINLEKLGRAADKPFNINGMASSPAWTEVLKTAQAQTKTKVAPNIPFATPDSDHYAFGASQIPAVMLYVSSNQDEAHFPSDTSEKVNFDRTAEAARFALSMLLDLASRQNRPEYAPPPFPDLGIVAHLASSAEADARGLSAPQGGLKVTGVVPGLPASVGGLQTGDFIYELANYKFQRDDL